MDYTKADLRKFFLAGRRFGLLENEDNTPMNFNEFFDVYTQIQEDIKEDQADHLTEMMEISQKAGLYDDFTSEESKYSGYTSTQHVDKTPKSDFLGRNIEPIFTEVDIADAIYMSKVGVGSVNGSTYLTTHQIIEKLKDRKWPKK